MCSVIVSIALGIPYLMDPMVMSVLYVWCQINRDEVVIVDIVSWSFSECSRGLS